MADIELVIKIPEEIRIAISRMGLLRIPDEMQKNVDRAIQKGTPLPKGHGRLIDGDRLVRVDHIILESTVDNAPTIIEADKNNIK